MMYVLSRHERKSEQFLVDLTCTTWFARKCTVDTRWYWNQSRSGLIPASGWWAAKFLSVLGSCSYQWRAKRDDPLLTRDPICVHHLVDSSYSIGWCYSRGTAGVCVILIIGGSTRDHAAGLAQAAQLKTCWAVNTLTTLLTSLNKTRTDPPLSGNDLWKPGWSMDKHSLLTGAMTYLEGLSEINLWHKH